MVVYLKRKLRYAPHVSQQVERSPIQVAGTFFQEGPEAYVVDDDDASADDAPMYLARTRRADWLWQNN